MLKPNAQIELHPAWMWTCDECGGENFERCITKYVEVSVDEIFGEGDLLDDDCECDECTGLVSDGLIGDDSLEDESEYDPDDGSDDDDVIMIDDMVIHGTRQSVPEQVRCKHCETVFDDVVVGYANEDE